MSTLPARAVSPPNAAFHLGGRLHDVSAQRCDASTDTSTRSRMAARDQACTLHVALDWRGDGYSRSAMVANTEIAFFRASKLSARPRRAENPARERRCTLPDQPSRASRGELRQTNGWAGLAEKNIHLPSKRGSMTRVSFCCSRDTTYTTHGEGNLRPGICGFPSSEGR